LLVCVLDGTRWLALGVPSWHGSDPTVRQLRQPGGERTTVGGVGQGHFPVPDRPTDSCSNLEVATGGWGFASGTLVVITLRQSPVATTNHGIGGTYVCVCCRQDHCPERDWKCCFSAREEEIQTLLPFFIARRYIFGLPAKNR